MVVGWVVGSGVGEFLVARVRLTASVERRWRKFLADDSHDRIQVQLPSYSPGHGSPAHPSV